ncbi:MAG: hypothetical protein KAT71_02930 [Gammaproteobacteria bacterium]|nr:hypothetical protein [Gammaproteobacteria bacterium]
MHKTTLKKSAVISSIIVIIAFAVVGQFVTDCYLPSLPAIAHTFLVPDSYAQIAITLFVLGATLSQLIFGPLSSFSKII